MIELIKRFGYRPRFCVWELTLACNLQCLHCGSYAGARREDELSLDECLDVADQLAAAGCEKVTLGGGEPTLNPDWATIGRRLTDRGVRVNIISNGWCWTAQQLEQSRQARLINVAFSLDGFEDAHDKIRRQDSFRRVVEAIDLNVAAGMPTSVITTVMQPNRHQLPAFRDFLGEHGVSSWQIQIGSPSGSMTEHREMVIAPEDLLWLVPQLAALRSDGVVRPAICPSDNVGYFGKYEKALRDRGTRISFWLGCRAGCQVIGIESNGNVKGCLSLPSARHGNDIFVEGNLRHEPLAAIWARPGAFAYNRAFSEGQLSGFCAACRYRDICRGGCSWTAYSHTRDRYDNPYCFYRQAVLNRRLDLLGDDEPDAGELALALAPEKRAEGGAPLEDLPPPDIAG